LLSTLIIFIWLIVSASCLFILNSGFQKRAAADRLSARDPVTPMNRNASRQPTYISKYGSGGQQRSIGHGM